MLVFVVLDPTHHRLYWSHSSLISVYIIPFVSVVKTRYVQSAMYSIVERIAHCVFFVTLLLSAM